jgi:hypothetical protein
MASVPLSTRDFSLRKPPTPAQYNFITGSIEIIPEQLDLELPELDDVMLPHDGTVTLLTTESGAQLLVAGFGLYLGKKSERLVVKQGKAVCAQVPFLRLQEVIVASRGVSFSSDLIEELCERGIRLACITSSGKPVALITSPMLTATVETRRAQLRLMRASGALRCAGGSSPGSSTTRRSCCGISPRAGKARHGSNSKRRQRLYAGFGVALWVSMADLRAKCAAS